MDEKNNEAYIRQNIWENKHFSIEANMQKFQKYIRMIKKANQI